MVVVYEKVVAGRVGHGAPSFLLAVALIVPLTVVFARGFAAVFEIPFQRHRGWPGWRLPALSRPESTRPGRPYSRRAAS